MLPDSDERVCEGKPTPVAYRRFALIDLMIVVATCAVAMAWHRWFADEFATRYQLGRLQLRQGMLPGQAFYWFWFQQWAPFLIMMTMTGSAFLLRAPRPHWSDLRGQPGLVACVAAMMSILYTATELTVLNTLVARGYPIAFTSGAIPIQLIPRMADVGSFVVVAWATLLVLGQWRPEPNWADRFGRLVGVAWIVYFMIMNVWRYF